MELAFFEFYIKDRNLQFAIWSHGLLRNYVQENERVQDEARSDATCSNDVKAYADLLSFSCH